MGSLPVGQRGVPAFGSWNVKVTMDTGPILGTVERSMDINIDK